MSGLVPLPRQPAGVSWPAGEWPRGELPAGVELDPLLDQVFDDEGPLATTFAVLVVHEEAGGRGEHFARLLVGGRGEKLAVDADVSEAARGGPRDSLDVDALDAGWGRRRGR